MIDKVRLRQDAEYVLESETYGPTVHLAQSLIRILDDPKLVIPEGYAIVKKPELLGIGVPAR